MVSNDGQHDLISSEVATVGTCLRVQDGSLFADRQSSSLADRNMLSNKVIMARNASQATHKPHSTSCSDTRTPSLQSCTFASSNSVQTSIYCMSM